ncbi:MAG: type III pantothenate kinase [Maribacter sp.]
MNIAIDIGNTRMKVGLFERDDLIHDMNIANDDINALIVYLNKHQVEKVILSSTAIVAEELEEYLKQQYHYIRLSTTTPVPIQSTYTTPKTLGKDRVAAVIGAASLFPKKDCLVIDAGTCITYDLINANNVYLGGNIAPGISMRLRAMDEFTAALPLVSKQHPDTDRGYSTETAIRNGAVWGTALEVQGFIQRFDQQTETLTTILTGGDASLLDKLINWNTCVESHLVLIGLNKILEYNAA